MFANGNTPNTFSKPCTILPPNFSVCATVDALKYIPLFCAASAISLDSLPKPKIPLVPFSVAPNIGAKEDPAKLKKAALRIASTE